MDKMYDLSGEEKEEIKSSLVENLQKEDRIKFAYIHGSFLKGKFHDIDIAVYVEEVVDKKDILDFELEKEVELCDLLKIPVDLKVMNNAPTHFCYKVIKDGELLFSKDESARPDFESLVLVKHHDFKYYRERYRKEVLGV
ncbi:MAG: type VII toxin-antitoxin system MntA family adenylyltransferase antitoxin [Thermoplasmata archaeon]